MQIGAPEGFVEHASQSTFFVGDPLGRVWAWLNVHHGPFLHAAGAIGEVRGPGEGPA